MKPQNGKRMTHKEKEAKFTPVVSLLLKSRQANSEMTKVTRNKATTDEIKSKAKTNAEAASKEARNAQNGYTPSDVRMLLEQFGQFIYKANVVGDGAGKVKWDSVSTAWMVKGMYDVIDDRVLPREDKDEVMDRTPLRNRYMDLHLAFIAACEAVGYTPKYKVLLYKDTLEFVDANDRSRSGKVIDTNYGLQEGTVREVLIRLNEAVSRKNSAAKAQADLVERAKMNEEANKLNELAGDLKRKLNSARLGYWLKNRKAQEPAGERDIDTASLPEGVTLNADTTKGVATVGETLAPVDEAFEGTRPE